uniref:MFS domain-containing protein n=1 Tax=Haemonchus placei TaxID=6290 RepID=A0A0N4X004_HAEPC
LFVKPPATPWGSILTSRAVWACWFGHFAGDWGAYTMLVSLPSFLKDVLGLDLSSLGMVSAVPYIAYFVVINIGGFLADFIRSKNILGTLNTRRAAMLLALLGQGMFLVLSGYCGCGQEALVIIYLTAGMAISGLQYSGFVVNYLDIAPSFSGTIMGMGNTISCLAGIVSPIVTSALTPNGTQEEWQGVLWLTAGILAIGSIVFSLFASGEVQEWAKLKGGEAPEELPLKEAEANLEKDTH